MNKNKKSQVWIAGDFNLPDINWKDLIVSKNQYNSQMNQIFLDTFLDLGLEQVVESATRNNNILDIFLTNQPNLITSCSNSYSLSDHEVVEITSRIKPSRKKQVKRKIHLWNKANLNNIKNDASKFSSAFLEKHNTSENPNHLWKCIKDSLNNIINEHVPTKTTSTKLNQPWLNTEVKRLIRQKNKLYKKQKSTNCNKIKNKYQEIKRKTQKECRKAHENYLNDIFNEDEVNKKKLWSYIKGKAQGIGNTISDLKNDQGRLIQDNKEKADILNNQFFSVFSEPTGTFQGTLNPKTKTPTMSKININNKGVLTLLNKLKENKATGADSIPSRILKICSNELAPVLTVLFQASLDQGKIPDDWKSANIVPIYKKGDKTQAENYRPVSLTSITCKLLEHIIHSSIMDHFDSFNVLTDCQHGFRKSRSCESQLVTTIKDFTDCFENNEQIDAILLDFSKAFDKVHHENLLLKLDHYGIRDNLKDWIRDFLNNRTQKVVLEGKESSPKPVLSGVPQGTVMGPLLFLVYINDMAERLSHNTKLRLFADDSLLYRTISTIQDAVTLQKDLDSLTEWEKDWKMSFHPKKCQVISFSSKADLKFKHDYNIHNTNLERTDNAKYLGVSIDNKLNWKKHINDINKSANSVLFFLKRHLKSCSPKIKEQCYFTYVRPKLEYASSVWDPHLKEEINKIEKIQRRAARFVLNNYDPRASCTEMLKELKWTPLDERRAKTKITLIYKARNKLVHIPLDHLKPNTSRTRAASNGNSYVIPRSESNVHLHSFFPSSIRLCNAIPSSVKDCMSIDTFKDNAKILTLRNSYCKWGIPFLVKQSDFFYTHIHIPF